MTQCAENEALVTTCLKAPYSFLLWKRFSKSWRLGFFFPRLKNPTVSSCFLLSHSLEFLCVSDCLPRSWTPPLLFWQSEHTWEVCHRLMGGGGATEEKCFRKWKTARPKGGKKGGGGRTEMEQSICLTWSPKYLSFSRRVFAMVNFYHKEQIFQRALGNFK